MVALQELTLFHNYPQIYWNTAVLTVESASVEEYIDEDFIEVEYDEDGEEIEEKKKAKAVKYGKIAKAIGEIRKAGIHIAYPDINSAKRDFRPDAEEDVIYYSLKALSGVGDAEVDQILELRPFQSLEDFLSKVKIKKPGVVSLIKSGAFEKIENEDKVETMKKYIDSISDKKTKLTLQNFNGLYNAGIIPSSLDEERALYFFNKYIKQKQFKQMFEGSLILDDRSQQFMMNSYPDAFERTVVQQNGMITINAHYWDKQFYQKGMDPVRNWLKKNQASILEEYNSILFKEVWNKYASGSTSKWEMDSMSFYYHDHEMKNINYDKFRIADYSSLSPNPTPVDFWNIKGKKIPKFDIVMIVGTCIDKEKTRGSFTILTPDGSVLEIRLRKEQFAVYNKQISEMQSSGNKKVMEKSWFTKGNKLAIVGYRRGDSFVSKRYKDSPYEHSVYLIKDFNEETGDVTMTSSRYGEY